VSLVVRRVLAVPKRITKDTNNHQRQKEYCPSITAVQKTWKHPIIDRWQRIDLQDGQASINFMVPVTLLPVMHRGGEQILICFPTNSGLDNAVRRIPAVKWSQTHRSWYLPLGESNYKLIMNAIRSMATVNSETLRLYLLKRKAVKATEVPIDLPSTQPTTDDIRRAPVHSRVIVSPEPTAAYRLSYENLGSLQKMVDLLVLKGYSHSTIRTYRGEVVLFFQVLGKHPAPGLTTEDVKRWLLKCLKEGLSENTLHSRINALKFFYEQVLGREKFFLEIPRPKKHQQLPKVLGEQEITRLFNAVTNLKHKAILFTAYSAGLRVSEVVNMKLKDIDSDRMQILVEKAKGKKDRFVTLSPVLLDILRKYIQGTRPAPKVYLFEGQGTPGTIYSARTAQRIFQLAREKAGIKKEVSFHSLRHSFATHILEKGIDIRYIKDILGHFNIKTTERYLHVKRDQLVNIVSPLDDIWKKGGLEW